MTLVEEAGFDRRIRQALPGLDQRLDPVEATQRQVAMGAGAEKLAEVTRQAPAVAPGAMSEVIERDCLVEVVVDVFACDGSSRKVMGSADKAAFGDAGEGDDKRVERVILGHGVQVGIQCVEQCVGGHRQLLILRDTGAEKGQGAALDDVLNQRRRHIHAAIVETRVGAGATIV